MAQPCPLSSFGCLSAVSCGAAKSELREHHIGNNNYRWLFTHSDFPSDGVPGRETNTSQLEPASTPTPPTTRSKQSDELKYTVTTQHKDISTLQTQLANLGASHESYIEDLSDNHSAEATSLKNNVRALEEQLARRPGLRHGM